LDLPVLWGEKELAVSPQIDTLLEENKHLKAENLRLEIELKFWKEKFEQQMYLEAYRILQQKQREPIGF
jgi:hypothetical protein